MSGQCPGCNGQGKRVQVVQLGHMIQQHISDCPQCQGSGQFIPEHNRCKKCMGKGYQMDQKKRTVGIKAGLDHGNKVHLPQKGHFTKHGRGDLIVVLQLQKHPLFTRHKNNLYAQIELTLYQAMCGFDKVITHLDGRKLHIRHQSNTPFHTVRRIHEEGLRGVDVPSKGHLYIVFTIRLPSIQHLDKSIQDEWKQSLQSFDEDEVAREKLIQNDFSVFPTLLLDTEDPKQHIALFHHLMEENNEQQQHHQQQQQHQEPQPGCVHQ
jgi:DnaJ family protein A protein 2